MSGPMVEVRKTPTEACQSQRSSSIDRGFDTANLYLFALDPPRDGFSAEEANTVFERLPGVLREIGNIEAVTMAARPPFSGLAVALNSRVRVAGEFDGTAQYAVLRQQVGPGYFSTLDIALLQGREFRENDQRPQAGDLPTPREIPVVLNQAAAAALLGAGSVLGRRIEGDGQLFSVIGVAQDVKSAFLNADTVPTMFVPITAEDFAASSATGTTVVVRAMDRADPWPAVRAAVEAAWPGLVPFNAQTMGAHIQQFSALILWGSMINGGIGFFGLVLAIIGLGAVTGHAAARRQKELAIRIALGAGARQVKWLVVREGVWLVAIGSLFGLAGAFAFSRLFAAVTAELADVIGTSAGDSVILVGTTGLLVIVTLLACYLPAMHSTRINPLAALQGE